VLQPEEEQEAVADYCLALSGGGHRAEAAAAGWGRQLGCERGEALEGRRGRTAAHMVESTGRRRGGGSDS
jgi:hypothetical protein